MSDILTSFLSNESALKRYLSRFFSRAQDIEDVVQETFLKAFVAEIKTEVHYPKAFLFKVAKHIALHEIEKKVNATTDYVADINDTRFVNESHEVGADEALELKRKLFVFSKALAALPPKCRQVFYMRKVEGLQVKEIARVLQMTVSGVEKHVATGLVKCSLYFREQGYAPEELGPIAVRHDQQRVAHIAKQRKATDG
ncbi:MAG: RNA polymerase sigma factor [Xanthomonadales bacterium]|nr:RNA polymerase sigma factor [Xanthomonadales bacterium]